jgi:hypothetical protein
MPLESTGAVVTAYSETGDARATAHLRGYLLKEIDKAETSVCNGQLPFDQYKFSTGRIRGLRDALDAMERVLQSL